MMTLLFAALLQEDFAPERLLVKDAEMTTAFYFSSDGKRFARSFTSGGSRSWVIDGKATEPYEMITEFLFSPDGNRVVYSIQQGKLWMPVIDGVKGKPFSGMFSGGRYRFSADGKRLAYIHSGRVYGKMRWTVVVDGVEMPASEQTGYAFSPDGKRFGYYYKENGEDAAVLDGVKDEGRFHQIKEPAFSPDSRLFGFIGTTPDFKDHLVVMGNKRETFDNVSRFLFHPNGKDVGMVVRDGKRDCAVNADRKSESFKAHPTNAYLHSCSA